MYRLPRWGQLSSVLWLTTRKAHPALLNTQRALLQLWRASDSQAKLSLDTHISHCDHFRILHPGDPSFALASHIDGGYLERWRILVSALALGLSSAGAGASMIRSTVPLDGTHTVIFTTLREPPALAPILAPTHALPPSPPSPSPSPPLSLFHTHDGVLTTLPRCAKNQGVLHFLSLTRLHWTRTRTRRRRTARCGAEAQVGDCVADAVAVLEAADVVVRTRRSGG